MRSESEMKMDNKITCKKCGAEYDVSLVRCPYCQTAYAPAEEEEYMGRLEEIREDLHRETEKGDLRIRKGMSKAARTILLTVIVILLLLFGVLWLSGRRERSHSDREKEEFLQNLGITTQQEETDQ